MKIYLDVLIITNCIMTMVYLQCISRITHSKISRVRIVISSLTGGISSLIVAVNTQGFIQSCALTTVKFILIGLIVFIAFNIRKPKDFAKYIFLYFFIELIFAGVSLLLWQITDSRIIYVKNYTIYFDISLIHLVIAAVTIYGIISVYEWLLRRKFNAAEKYKATYSIGNYEIELPAIADSGNKLCDVFTGMPIVIFYSKELFEHFNLDNESSYPLGSFHVTPYSTVVGEGVMPVTSKGSVTITDSSGKTKLLKCCVGIIHNGKNKSRAIFNPCLLQ
ncbi:MAG: sigma-E processing peptidase SpoIIGA [Ruminococcus sp.]|nr:sigma-E processing peptidase SpoIIGA [Ruminococcus sp.]